MGEGPESVRPLRGRSQEGQRGVSRPHGDSDVRGVRGATEHRRASRRAEGQKVKGPSVTEGSLRQMPTQTGRGSEGMHLHRSEQLRSWERKAAGRGSPPPRSVSLSFSSSSAHPVGGCPGPISPGGVAL